jgi:hypothetical protein
MSLYIRCTSQQPPLVLPHLYPEHKHLWIYMEQPTNPKSSTPFNNGPRPQGQQQPGYYEGRPPTATCNGLAAFCIYSSVSGSIYSSVSGSIQEGIMDAIGLNGNHRSTTIVYVPTPGPGQYSNGGYRPNQGGNYGGYQPNQGGNNGWPAQPQPGPGQYQNNGWKE